jgi:translation initiation factor 4G
MYAQACQKLSQRAPNFDTTWRHGTPPSTRLPSTFLKLLLRKCQAEFETRAQSCALAAAAIDISKREIDEGHAEGPRRKEAAEAALAVSRRKMLGNIAFIGELAKLELLSETIVHACIKQLVVKVEAPNLDDLECVCKLLSSVGTQIDEPAAKVR